MSDTDDTKQAWVWVVTCELNIPTVTKEIVCLLCIDGVHCTEQVFIYRDVTGLCPEPCSEVLVALKSLFDYRKSQLYRVEIG
jgi:hypothetical protein